jgi:hypothetical protein
MAEDKIIRLDNLREFKEKIDEYKQDKLTPGANINIDSDGVISATAESQQQAD